MVEFPVFENHRAAKRRCKDRGELWRPDGIPLSLPIARAEWSAALRFRSVPRSPPIATARAPAILIGLGARWSAKAAVDDLTSTNARLSVENENYREATGQLSAQVSALQAAVDEIGITAAVDPAASRAMERLGDRALARHGRRHGRDNAWQRARPRRNSADGHAQRSRRHRASSRRRAYRCRNATGSPTQHPRFGQ